MLRRLIERLILLTGTPRRSNRRPKYWAEKIHRYELPKEDWR